MGKGRKNIDDICPPCALCGKKHFHYSFTAKNIFRTFDAAKLTSC
jgi:hypothetical protein